jgi:uncharacterized protein (DUF1800 family)
VDDTRHLQERIGFAAAPSGAGPLSRARRAAAVRRALASLRTGPMTALPSWVGEAPIRPGQAPTPEERERRRKAMREQGRQLRLWWLGEMRRTASPTTERLVLFWHNHFTSEMKKVRFAPLMLRQNQLFRSHAAGSFRQLLHEVSRDAAMLIYLDSRNSRAEHPNENFARELLELFTLGEGHYGERDIQEAARAFTGWSLEPASGRFRFRWRWHDAGEKVFLGRRGRFDGRDIINIILEQPRTAVFLVSKLWREFVSPVPHGPTVSRLAEGLRKDEWRLAPTLERLWTSDAFWAEEHRHRLVKSPAELVVGAARRTGLSGPGDEKLVRAMRGMGQHLLDPPNVKGWPGGSRWITTATLPVRDRFLQRAARASGDDELAGAHFQLK